MTVDIVQTRRTGSIWGTINVFDVSRICSFFPIFTFSALLSCFSLFSSPLSGLKASGLFVATASSTCDRRSYCLENTEDDSTSVFRNSGAALLQGKQEGAHDQRNPRSGQKIRDDIWLSMSASFFCQLADLLLVCLKQRTKGIGSPHRRNEQEFRKPMIVSRGKFRSNVLASSIEDMI
jgi:hypothetical protein